MKLTEEQINILKEGKIEGNKFYLQGQLDRKQYKTTNDILNTIGLKWNRKEKAHIIEGFTEEELKEAIQEVVEEGEVETLKETIKKFQYYPTPKKVVEYLIKLADIKEGETILEPSAGQGSISDLIIKNKKTLVELKKGNYDILKKKEFYNDDCIVINKDFLDCYIKDLGKFDKIIANPPFSKSQDAKHILHMYDLLKKGGRIVSIASNSIKTRIGKVYDKLKELNPQFIELPEGSFKESGTLVNTVIVLIDK